VIEAEERPSRMNMTLDMNASVPKDALNEWQTRGEDEKGSRRAPRRKKPPALSRKRTARTNEEGGWRKIEGKDRASLPRLGKGEVTGSFGL